MKSEELKLLFITEKWCDGRPEGGLTNNYHNLFSTFKAANPNLKFNILHLDEIAHKLRSHIDNIIPEVCDKIKPNCVIFSLLGNSNLNPTRASYEYFKKNNVKMIFMWADVSEMWGKKEIEQDLVAYADLHVCWGSEHNLNTNTKILWLFAPQDEKLYYPETQKQKVFDVSFAGSTRYQERQAGLNHLLNSGIKVNINGGQREVGLSPEDYSFIIRNSKINLNFAQGPNGVYQCKGRVWEVLASKTLLIEKINDVTRKHLKPGIHYVAYSDLDDLVRKINYYSRNDNEREAIAEAGHRLYKEKYTYLNFWNTVMSNVGVSNT